MHADCNSQCGECSVGYSSTPAARPSRTTQHAGWRQDALFELEELGDFFGIDVDAVKL
ncbi:MULTISPECIES: hypothetical protein [unclassified Streptomyces]|uniref:hypothetical protein n=1 Tax=Streptomyces sp. NPDC055082 TaxID=3365718 RepID=UPI0037D0B49A